MLWDECGHFRLLGGKRRTNKMWMNWISPERRKIGKCRLILNILSRSTDINTHQASIMTFGSPTFETPTFATKEREVLNATYVKQTPVTVFRIPQHFKLYHTFCNALLIACPWVIKISRDMVTNKRPALYGCLSGTCFRSLHTHREKNNGREHFIAACLQKLF